MPATVALDMGDIHVVVLLLLLAPAIGPLSVIRVPAALAQTESGAAGTPELAVGEASAPGREAVTPTRENSPEWVIPPGQEELLGKMLGLGTALPGPCKFTGAEAHYAVIRATYGCPQGEVVFELHHPSDAPQGGTATARFAIVTLSGSPPQGLTDALASLIRSQETGFEWKRLRPPSVPFTRGIVLLAAAGLLGGLAVAWVLSRRRAATTP